jgi:uncharacterized membrane protein YphA (DoxX/SURF4 family)
LIPMNREIGWRPIKFRDPESLRHFPLCRCIAGLEFFGGILLILGLGTRIVAFLMAANMLVA